jgi:hypothetical protein
MGVQIATSNICAFAWPTARGAGPWTKGFRKTPLHPRPPFTTGQAVEQGHERGTVE